MIEIIGKALCKANKGRDVNVRPELRILRDIKGN